MTQDFEAMLYLFGKGAVGGNISVPTREFDAARIRKLAIEQGIWTIVYPALTDYCDLTEYQNEFFRTVSKGITRNDFTLNIIKQLEAAGITVCLLKGVTVSRLYNDPDCRISGDTDILINPRDVEKTVSVLLDLGYEMEKYTRNSHHLKARHPIGGLLEIHISLYRSTDEQIVFNGLKLYEEPYTKLDINGYTVKTLGINDGLMYLTAHFIKHLVKKGSGIRQVMDLLLYMREYKDEIDFEKYDKILKELRYGKLIDVVKSIGEVYFGLDYPTCYPEIMNRILDDMESGGVFGFESDTRADFYDRYCKRRTTMSERHFKKFFSSKSERSTREKLFPSRRILIATGYEYAKNTFLVPLAWLNRYFDLLLRRRREATDKRRSTEIEARMKLMQDLNMID